MITVKQRSALCAHLGVTAIRESRDGIVWITTDPEHAVEHKYGFGWRKAGKTTDLLAALGDPSCEVVAVATGRRIGDLCHSLKQAHAESNRWNVLLGGPLTTARKVGAAMPAPDPDDGPEQI